MSDIRKHMELVKENSFIFESSDDIYKLADVSNKVEKKVIAIAKKLKGVNPESDKEYIAIIKKEFEPVIKYIKTFKLSADIEISLIHSLISTIGVAAQKEKNIPPRTFLSDTGWLKYF